MWRVILTLLWIGSHGWVQGEEEPTEGGPSFDETTPTEVKATVGKSAVLLCRVNNVTGESVAWIRNSDLHIISINELIYSADQRFDINRSGGGNRWDLKIKYVEIRDSGEYDCQVSTSPPINRRVRLIVSESDDDESGAQESASGETKISERTPHQIRVSVGQKAILPCTVYNLKEFTVAWVRGLDLLSIGAFPYIADTRIQVSHPEGSNDWNLEINPVSARDDGEYDCQISTHPPIQRRIRLTVDDNPRKPAADEAGPSESGIFGESGLQPGTNYVYQYKGRLASGITQLKHQFSAIGIEADLTLQVLRDNSITMKFSKVRVGSFHDELSCDWRQPIPMEYGEMGRSGDQLEKPFRVGYRKKSSLFANDEFYMAVPAGEPVWITNIRKAVVNMFPLWTLWGEIGSKENGFSKSNFGKQEKFFGGQCMKWYTVTKMPEVEAFVAKKHRANLMKTDFPQRRPSSSEGGEGPSLSEDMWSVTRTVDYDDCQQLLEVKENSDEDNIESLVSRVSESRYVIRGDSAGIRLESAVSEGSISVFLNNTSSEEHIDTLTNQTLELTIVEPTQHEIVMGDSVKEYSSWQYEGDAPEEGSYPSLAQKLTGTLGRISSFEHLKDAFSEFLPKFAFFRPNNDDFLHLVNLTDGMIEAVSYMSYGDIDSFYRNKKTLTGSLSEDLVKKQSYALKKIMIYAGTEASVSYLLDLLEEESDRKEEIISLFFDNIETSLKAPALVPRIMELAVSLSWTPNEDLIKTFALTTSAKLAEKLCLNPEKRKMFKNSFVKSESVCNIERVIDFFIPYLKEGIQNTSAPSWQRVIYMQSLINLRTPLATGILQPIILGAGDESVSLRITAISSLSSKLLPRSAIGMVYNLLTPIIENTGETPEVRSVAFITMTSWHPGPSWWKHMALSTWHEPSTQFSNFVSSTIHSLATYDEKLKEVVSKVVYLAKPSAFPSLSYSSYLNYKEDGAGISVMWIATREGIIPVDFFIRLTLRSPSGRQWPVLEFDALQSGMWFFSEIARQYIDQFTYGDDARSEEASSLFDAMMRISEELGFQMTGFISEAQLYMKFFDDFIFAKNVDFYRGGHIFGFINEFQRHLEMDTGDVDFWENHHKTLAFPTDIGLPCVIKDTSVGSLMFTTNEDVPKAPEIEGLSGAKSFGIQFKYIERSNMHMETLVPWLQVGVGSLIQRDLIFDVPLNFHVYFSARSLQLYLKIALPDKPVKLKSESNLPFTGMFHDLKVESPATLITSSLHFKELSGDTAKLQFQLLDSKEWYGDSQAHLWRSTAHWTSSIEFRTSFTGNSVPLIIDFDLPFPVENMLRVPESPEEPVEGESKALIDKMRAISSRLQQIRDDVPSGEVSTPLAIVVGLQGSLEMRHELYLARIVKVDKGRKETRWRLLLDSTPVPGTTIKFVSELLWQVPNLLPLMSLEELLSTDLDMQSKMTIELNTPIVVINMFEAKAIMKVTESHLKMIRNKAEAGCEYNSEFPVMDITSSPIYNYIQVNASWEPGFSPQALMVSPPFLSGVNMMGRSLSFTAGREAGKGRWIITIPGHSEVIDSSNMLDDFAYPASWLDGLSYYALGGGSPRTCGITGERVYTFDGERFPFHPSGCWKIAALETVGNTFMVQVRYTSKAEAKVVWRDRGLAFEMAQDQIQVNGESAAESDERYEIFKLNNAILLSLANGIVVKVSDKIEIQVPLTMRSRVSGLCGRYDGERSYDLVSPKGCVYVDHDLFASSWEISGDCDESTHRGRMEEVAERQWECFNETYIPTGVSHPYVQDACLAWRYEEKEEGECHCRATTPTPSCASGCSSRTLTEDNILFDCRPMEGKDARCHQKKYSVLYPNDCKQLEI